jgi:hypothetical protein
LKFALVIVRVSAPAMVFDAPERLGCERLSP